MTMELDLESLRHGKELVKRGFARMQKGGVIMDVVNAEQADIAEKAGAVAVMALERVPSDIRADGGVARMSNPTMITEIVDHTSIPVMAKCRIGHTAEAKVLEALGVDMVFRLWGSERRLILGVETLVKVVDLNKTVIF